MTIEQRTFIPLTDIVGIEFECGHCQSRHLIPLKRFDRILYECPNCHEQFISITPIERTLTRSDESILRAFIKALDDMQLLKVKIRLELSEGTK
jgi:hypothetical protein